MRFETFDGKPVHVYYIRGIPFFVTRGESFFAVLDRDEYGAFVAVFASEGISFRRAARKAAAALEMGEFR